jgi:hypothetical protein
MTIEFKVGVLRNDTRVNLQDNNRFRGPLKIWNGKRHATDPGSLGIPSPDVIGMEFAMSVEEAILERVRKLPPDKQSELLEIANSMSAEAQFKPPLINPEGLWAEFDIDITAEDIAELRREMWKNFPREF